MIHHIFLFLLPAISVSQYYNPSLYQSYLNAGVPRQQTVLVPVYTQGGYGGVYGGGGYSGYGMSNPAYGMGYGLPSGYPMMGAGMPCCGAGGVGAMPQRESNAKKFLRGATEGVFMGSFGMLGFRR